MKPVVYLDVIVMINLVLNFIILYFSVKFSGKKPVLWRIFLGSLLGSIYAVLIFIPQLALFYTLFFKVAMSFLIMLVSVRVKHIKELVKSVLIFFVTSFVFGGCVLCVFYIFGKTQLGQTIADHVAVSLHFPYLVFSAAVAAGVLLYRFFLRYTRHRMVQQSNVVPVEIRLKEQKIIVNTLIDTGCDLMDPLTRTPVLIVERKALERLLPAELLTISDSYDLEKQGDYQVFVKNHLRLVPYRVLSQSGLLLAVKADEVKILKENGGDIRPCLIGIYQRQFGSEFYHALIGQNAVTAAIGEGEEALCGI